MVGRLISRFAILHCSGRRSSILQCPPFFLSSFVKDLLVVLRLIGVSSWHIQSLPPIVSEHHIWEVCSTLIPMITIWTQTNKVWHISTTGGRSSLPVVRSFWGVLNSTAQKSPKPSYPPHVKPLHSSAILTISLRIVRIGCGKFWTILLPLNVSLIKCSSKWIRKDMYL